MKERKNEKKETVFVKKERGGKGKKKLRNRFIVLPVGKRRQFLNEYLLVLG